MSTVILFSNLFYFPIFINQKL